MTLKTGARLGPYEILSPLDVAGIGEVYRGRDHEQGRDVAIRVLRIDAAADPTLLWRLEDDARTAAAVTHPDILDIYDVVVDARAVYVVSAPLEDKPVRAMLNSGVPQPRRRRLAWVAVFGLLALVTAVALPVTRYVERARRGAQATRVAVVEPTTSAAAGSTAAVMPSTDPPTEPVASLFEATIEEGSMEEIEEVEQAEETAVSDEVPVRNAEAEAEAVVEAAPAAGTEAEAPVREEASSGSRTVPLDGDAAPGDVAGPARDGGFSLAAAGVPVSEPSLTAPTLPPGERDTTSLITEALVRATEFDLLGASDLLRVPAERGDSGAEVALVYVRGLIDAREAFRDGGTAEALAPVQEAIGSLEAIAQGRRGSAEIARLLLQAAAAAAQSERNEMRLYLETAVQMESVQHAAGLPGAPLVTAAETAGDLWIQVDRYDDARRSYTKAAERIGSSLRILAGLARSASGLKDVAAACASYRSLLDTWGARQGLPAEMVEARAYVDGVCAPAGS